MKFSPRAMVFAFAAMMVCAFSFQNAFAQAAQAAPQWVVNKPQSRITWSTQWAGQNVSGSFANFDADIRFNPNNLATSRVVATINMASFQTQSAEARENLPLADWLNTRAFPAARFEATRFRALGGNRYIAYGQLVFKGARLNLALPFTLNISGNNATMTSEVNLDRIALKVGVDSDASAEWVARQIKVNISLRATKH